MRIIPVDAETIGIEDRPVYPPKPVGVALKLPRNKYMAWGHPVENNCTKGQVRKALMEVWKNHIPLFHNAAFDIEVLCTEFDLPYPKNGYHDTLFLAYLHDPRDKDLSLKPLADKYLDMPPDEQDRLNEWILENIFIPQGKKPSKKDPLGKYIALAPGKLVGKYAIGDIVRTEKLFKYFMAYIKERGMLDAYMREIKVMPVFEGMSKRGLRVALPKLKKDVKIWTGLQDDVAKSIRRKLKCKDLNIGSGPQLAKALDKADKIYYWTMTKPSRTFPKGQRSTSIPNLIEGCSDKKLIEQLNLHSVLGTYISTFGEAWIQKATDSGGHLYPTFNQVRSPGDYSGMRGGTRSGRPSSSNPNLFNVPRNPYDEDRPWTGVLPKIRSYIIPEKGMTFLNRDYMQQEVRILAHFEEGALYRAFLEDPTMDVHNFVGDLIYTVTGVRYPRKFIKTINFGMVYGMGVPGLMKKLGCSDEEARALKAAHQQALPAVKDLSKDIKKISKGGEPIYTWGGREYYVEEPRKIEGRMRDFYYKLLNYLIQGSSAECTKEAMILVDDIYKHETDCYLTLQVYDELMSQCPKGDVKRIMKLKKDAMESIKFDVPMLTDGKTSSVSWGALKDYKD